MLDIKGEITVVLFATLLKRTLSHHISRGEGRFQVKASQALFAKALYRKAMYASTQEDNKRPSLKRALKWNSVISSPIVQHNPIPIQFNTNLPHYRDIYAVRIAR
jgi:hypothetical protein